MDTAVNAMATAPSARADLDALYRLAFQTAADALIIQEGGRIVQANDAAHRLLGEDLLDRDLLDFIPPRMRHLVKQALVAGGQCETRLMPPRGPAVPIRLRALPGEGHELIVLHNLAAARHEDDLHRKQHERDAEVARLEQLNHFKTQLLNTAAHELNTPLTPLRLQVHLLRSASLGTLTDRQARAVDVLERSTDRLTMLVSDILDVARLESGHLRMEVEDVRLYDLVEEAAQAYEETARGVGVSLEIAAARDLIVAADPRRVLQVLYNLVSNGIKFTPEGGRVRIQTGISEKSAFVEVIDTGLGLDEQQQEELFQPFSRVHDVETTAIPGTGLGLYISRGIIEQHGGTLQATSPGSGRGSTFRFTLPLAAGPTRPARTKSSPSPLVTGPLAQRLRELI